jgi:hypothetical protein
MKKVVFNGTKEQFDNNDFKKLMKEIKAEELAEEYKHFDGDFNDYYKRVNVYFYNPDEITLVHSEEPNSSSITLYGSVNKIGNVKKKVLEAIAGIPFDKEGFRKD